LFELLLLAVVVVAGAANSVPGNQIKMPPVMLELPLAEPGKTKVAMVVVVVVVVVAKMVEQVD
jgi:hypothetical protein